MDSETNGGTVGNCRTSDELKTGSMENENGRGTKSSCTRVPGSITQGDDDLSRDREQIAWCGIRGILIDFGQNKATYFLNDCTNTVFGMPASERGVALNFNAPGIQACVREAQAGQPGYTYKGFCDKVRGFGCAGYMVSFPGARVVYFGRTAETHVEMMPGD